MQTGETYWHRDAATCLIVSELVYDLEYIEKVLDAELVSTARFSLGLG